MDFILGYLLAANLWGFAAMGADKRFAIKGKRRIPERTLFTIAILGGAPGVYLGMRAFRHKTLHRQFTIGIPLIFVLQLMAVYLIFIR